MSKRVVITSLGAITAGGCGISRLWHSAIEGQSMIQRLKGIDVESYIGAQVDDLIICNYNA